MSELLTISCPELTASISLDRWEHEATTRTGRHGRYVFAYCIVIDPSGDAYKIEGCDLRSGSCSDEIGPDLPKMLATLLAFADSAAEHYSYNMDADSSEWENAFSREDSERFYQVSEEMQNLRSLIDPESLT